MQTDFLKLILCWFPIRVVDTDQIVITTDFAWSGGSGIKLTGPVGSAFRDSWRAVYQSCRPCLKFVLLCTIRMGVSICTGFYDDVLPVHEWEREELERYPRKL